MHFIYFLYTVYMHSIYISYTWKVKMKVKKRRPEKLKMVEKHFFPEMFGDLWGVICYHHWYPRAGLEGREKSYFSKKVLRLKKMQNYPLSIFHAAVRPESLPGADLSTFWKVVFSLFSGLFGLFRAHGKWRLLLKNTFSSFLSLFGPFRLLYKGPFGPL